MIEWMHALLREAGLSDRVVALFAANQDDRFEFGLDLIVRGLESLAKG